MEGFKVEKVTDVPGYSAKQIKVKRPLLRASLIVFSSCFVGITQGCVIEPPSAQINESINEQNILIQNDELQRVRIQNSDKPFQYEEFTVGLR